MNVIARLEYELAYYDSAVHRFNHYTTRTPPRNLSRATTPGQNGPGQQWQWRSTLHSQNLQGWSLTIRCFNVISRTLVGGGGAYPCAEMQLIGLSTLVFARRFTGMKSYALTFQIFSSRFDVYPKWVGTHWSSVFRRFEFQVSYHIFNFYKNSVLLSGRFPNLITYTQHIVSMLDTKHRCEQLFSKIKHARSTLRSQLSNLHLTGVLLPSASSFNPDISSFCDCKYQMSNKSSLLLSEFSWSVVVVVVSFYFVFRTATPGPLELIFVTYELIWNLHSFWKFNRN